MEVRATVELNMKVKETITKIEMQEAEALNGS